MSDEKRKARSPEGLEDQEEEGHLDGPAQPDSADEGVETKPQAEGSAPASREAASETAEDLKDQLLRALAEIENVRRRAGREREDATRYGITGLAKDIVGIGDNLRRAMESVEEPPQEGGEVVKSLRAGIAIIQQEFDTVLSRHGIEAINPLGETFDHNLHQAMYEVEEGEHPPGTVVQVLQQGYKIHDRLLRPAMVGVKKKASVGVSEQKKDPEPEK
ncbi:MAG: nucleotide exchange factor GrpE [Pseudomonadota bacterium]|nr:nucleotide exchange factor GrpE [Pseudomonadota bacterium]